MFFPFNTPRPFAGRDIEVKNNVLGDMSVNVHIRCPTIDGREHSGDELVPYDVDRAHLVLSLFRSPGYSLPLSIREYIGSVELLQVTDVRIGLESIIEP